MTLRTTQHEINRVAEYIFDDTHNVLVHVSILASARPSQYTINEHLVENKELPAWKAAIQGL